ncbi:hypothetical protein B5S28_g5282 [[Candida] boidinii]|nr:hypothetical protein B5S28_g5282 [[Candida] boidinii]
MSSEKLFSKNLIDAAGISNQDWKTKEINSKSKTKKSLLKKILLPKDYEETNEYHSKMKQALNLPPSYLESKNDIAPSELPMVEKGFTLPPPNAYIDNPIPVPGPSVVRKICINPPPSEYIDSAFLNINNNNDQKPVKYIRSPDYGTPFENENFKLIMKDKLHTFIKVIRVDDFEINKIEVYASTCGIFNIDFYSKDNPKKIHDSVTSVRWPSDEYLVDNDCDRSYTKLKGRKIREIEIYTDKKNFKSPKEVCISEIRFIYNDKSKSSRLGGDFFKKPGTKYVYKLDNNRDLAFIYGFYHANSLLGISFTSKLRE